VSKNRKMYRYSVTQVFPAGEGRVEVGAVLVDYWHGKAHCYQIEHAGNVAPFCTVELIGQHELSEAEIRASLPTEGGERGQPR
jgi:hypothetical protein